jgi:aminoglycoside phosphotransferase (APT) family kinase protein
MKPREALLMIPGFAHARVEEQLGEGATGVSWLVESGGERFVLRIDKPDAATLVLDRSSERDIQAAAARAGLTPEPLFHDRDRGVSLRRHAAGEAWSEADLRQPEKLQLLARALRDLHALPPAGRSFEPGAAARRYARYVNTPAARQLADEANILLAELHFEPFRECVCHNDLVADNIVDGGERPVLIDWEFAGLGDPWFDLAVVIAHHELAPELREMLVEAYLRRAASAREAARLETWCRFYRLLLQLWLMRVAPAEG